MDRGGFVAASVSFLNEQWEETRDVHFCSLPTDFVDLSVEDGRGEVVLVCARIAALVIDSLVWAGMLTRGYCFRTDRSWSVSCPGRISAQAGLGLQIHSWPVH